jgi:Cft2 family RNA processing exonuclease|tara:strand:+ start:16591 stop:17952 length:1362 start_codon:yes stop_codon:yes gene_type:complete
MVFKSMCRDVGIGANSYLLESGGVKVILDAGMHPKEEGLTAQPRYELIKDDTADAIFITHSHLDHVGTLPVASKRQRNAKIFISPETAELACAMLHNSVNVMESKRTELGITDYPFFNHRQLDRMKGIFERRNVGKKFDVDEKGKVQAEFFDAGHIMGSVGIMFEAEGKKVFYTGDVNFEDSTLQKGAIFPKEEVDVLIVETTRGEQPRRADYSRREEENELAKAINGALDRGGSALLPVFAMGKTQEVLAMLQRFKEEGLVDQKVPVYIGGLSSKMTTIYDKFSDVTRRNRRGFKFMTDMELAGGNKKRVGPIPFNNGCIYALSSGMMSPKTVSNNFARQGLLENKKHGLFFVGYAAEDTPGGNIRAAEHGDMVELDPAYPKVKLNCEVRAFDFSGHSTRDAIADFAVSVKPKKIFLVHGDDGAMAWFKQELETRLPGVEVIIPEPGVEFEI